MQPFQLFGALLQTESVYLTYVAFSGVTLKYTWSLLLFVLVIILSVCQMGSRDGSIEVDDEVEVQVMLFWDDGKKQKSIRDLVLDRQPEDLDILNYYRYCRHCTTTVPYPVSLCKNQKSISSSRGHNPALFSCPAEPGPSQIWTPDVKPDLIIFWLFSLTV